MAVIAMRARGLCSHDQVATMLGQPEEGGDGIGRQGEHESGEDVPARIGWARIGWARIGWARIGWARIGWARIGWARIGWARIGWGGTRERRAGLRVGLHGCMPGVVAAGLLRRVGPSRWA
jgi:hypothetical protein